MYKNKIKIKINKNDEIHYLILRRELVPSPYDILIE